MESRGRLAPHEVPLAMAGVLGVCYLKSAKGLG